MNSIRHSSARILGTPMIQSNARRLQGPVLTQKRAATTTGEPVEYGGYPKRIWFIIGAGSVSAYYLWHHGNAKAQAAAGEERQAHHGPNKGQSESVSKTPGDSALKKERV